MSIPMSTEVYSRLIGKYGHGIVDIQTLLPYDTALCSLAHVVELVFALTLDHWSASGLNHTTATLQSCFRKEQRAGESRIHA